MLEIVNLTRAYPAAGGQTTVEALQNISFEIETGGRMGIIAREGAGKSTLFRIVCGLMRPGSGDVVVNRQQLSQLADHQLAGWRLRHVGLLTARHNLLPALATRANVELPLWLAGVRREERHRRAHEALEATGMLELHSVPATRLTPLQRATLALARALVINPWLVLMDQPDAALDKDDAIEFLQVTAALCSALSITALLLTDNEHSAHALASARNSVYLHSGRIHDDPPPPRPAADENDPAVKPGAGPVNP
jgi:ABC-type methionine transport system ATPase subunit